MPPLKIELFGKIFSALHQPQSTVANVAKSTQNHNENADLKIVQVTTLRTICDIFNAVPSNTSLFGDVFRLLRILLTIPLTTATAEQTFCTLWRPTTYLRSAMTQTRPNHIMLLHTHKERTDELDMLQIAKLFIKVNDRRQLYFGRF